MNNKRKTIKDMHHLANSRGFQFISFTFTNVSTKHRWKCKNGHEWEAKPNGIQRGDGCPYCHAPISEEKCRFILSSLTKHEFPKTRSSLEGQLELDGFSKTLSIAFEYQGVQHYKRMWHHKTPEDFQEQQKRDVKKREICLKKKILLIEIPYYINKNNTKLENYIKKKLPANLIIGKVNWKKFGIKAKFEELKEILKSKNITCLSKKYIDYHTKFNLVCNVCGHKWRTKATNAQRNYGCPKCAGNMKLTTQHVIETCESKNIEFLDREYKNTRTKHAFKCKVCIYKWQTTFQCIKRAKSCPKCSLKRAVEKRKSLGGEIHKKMWRTLRKKYGPTGRKSRLTKEEKKERHKQANRRYYAKKKYLKEI